ncbi:hypothetical protein V473_02890 [Sphingobium cupriresistens LL01]|uniref:Uncharacterized protein n=1 Tax=Sphingobium cupriresistens LL01 TaxID=1420583 RepID=A0A0J8AX00_9SPHN|nr:hypothetical protein V473_02890 [Sphingobium cupriresistens LL01]
MLHDIAVGPFAEQPAGKSASPLAIGATAHVQLDESAGFLHIFPWRAGFARLQPHDRIAHAQRFARLHGEVAGQAVALVEQADDGVALRHRRGAGQRAAGGRPDRRSFDLDRSGLVTRGHVILAARGQRQRTG